MAFTVLNRMAVLGAMVVCVSLSTIGNASARQTDMASIKQKHCEKSNNLGGTFCMSRELEESDKRLNVVYKILVNALAKPQGLQSAQRAWIAFRDAQCRFRNEAQQGRSGYGFSMDLCLMQMTEQRISALEDVSPCNGCVEFKDEFYRTAFSFPERRRIPASGKP